MNRGALVLLVASIAACSVEPTAPAVALDHDPIRSFDQVTLRWMPPAAGDVKGYAIEARLVPGAFDTVGEAGLERTSFTYAIPADTPELTELEFRVRALPDDEGGRASAAIPFHRGLRPPAIACAACPTDAFCFADCAAVNGSFALSITNRSVLADGLLLERGVRVFPDEDPTWTAIPLAAASATFVDVDGAAEWIDGAKFEYRLSAIKGAESSAAATRAAAAAAPFAPRIVSVVSAGGAVEITAENTSRSAQRLLLQRSAWTDPWSGGWGTSAPAPAKGTTTVFRDAAPLSSRAFYDVSAISAWYGSAASDAWAIWPAPPTDLTVSTVVPPPGTSAVRTGPGASFATATLARGDRFALYAASGASVQVAGDGWLGAPGLALDALGHPHAVYGLGFSGPASLMHAWHDGERWLAEDVGVDPLDPITGYGQFVSFDVAPDGTVLACWSESETELRVALRSSVGWSFERVPLDQPLWGGPLVAGDAAGGVHVFVSHLGSLVDPGEHLFRDPGGAWSSEPIPGVVSGLSALLAGARGLALVGASSGSAWILERSAAGWGAVEPLGTIGAYDWVRAARSLDGQRVAVASSGGKLWVRDRTGTAAHTWTPTAGSFAVGFRGDGKAWVLSGISTASSWRGYPAALYEEP